MPPRKGSPPPPDPFAPLPLSPWEMEREKREALRIERDRLHQERIAVANREQAKRIAAANEEQRQLLVMILSGEARLHDIDPASLQGDLAKETLLTAKRMQDVLLGTRLDKLAHDALDIVDDIMRDTEATKRDRLEAAKMVLGARAKMAQKVANPGEAAILALLQSMGKKGEVGAAKALTDEELNEKLRLLLESPTDARR